MHLADDAAMAGGLGGMDSARNDQDAVDLAALTRALDAGQVDVAVHWLQLLLFRKEDGDQPPQEHRKVLGKRSRRLRTIQRAVTQMLNDCDKNDAGDGLTLRPGLASREAGASCELSYSQLQMFALHALQPASTAYNVVRALQFNSGVSLDLEALECTCNALMAKHEALRTCFDNTGGQPKQTVYPVSHFRGGLAVFGVVQTELLSPSNSDKELAAAVAKVADEPFDLTRQAPIRMYAFVSPDHILTSPWAIAVVLHHIVTDAASSQLFWKDFDELYARFVRNGDAKTMGPGYVKQLEVDASESSRLTYRDFAVWQRARMRSGIIAPQLQYWTYQLTSGGVPPLLELPFDMGDIKTLSSDSSAELNTPKATTTTGDIVVFRSTPALQKAFSALCHAQGASMFMGLLAVFHLLVERLSGQQDFVIGAPSSGRGSSEVEDVMGYFVNTLPLRLGTKCTGKETFKDFLMIVREVVLGAYNNMEIPFHKVLEHLRASAHSSHGVDDDAKRRWQHPLFQIMFSWEQSNSDEPLGDSSMNDYTELSLPHQSAKFDLMLSMRHRHLKGPSADRVLEGSMEYPTARFTRDTIKRFTSYYLELLEQVTRTPSALVRSPSICMLSDSERRQLVSKWGMPKPPASSSYLVQKPSSQFLDECLFSQAQRTPQHIALHFEGSQWTYKDLWSNSVRIAQALTMLDIPGDATELHVGLLLDRGLENVAAMVGTLHLKGVFVPLDPEFPRERLRYMAHDSCLQVIITQQKHASIAKDLSISAARDSGDDDDLLPCVLCYEDVEILTSQFESSHNESRLLRQHSHDAHSAPAYILYTSGSTGNPKGVVVPHAALMTTLWWTVRTYEVSTSDVFLQSTSATLDGSLSQLFSPLLVGGSARITRSKGLHDLHYMRNMLLEPPHITLCVFVPSYFALMMDFLSDRGDSFPCSVKHVVLAGEAFPIELARQFYRKHQESKTCLVNEYGPTEASITSTAFQLPRQMALQGNMGIIDGLQSVPIGKPIDEHPVLVLDTHRRLVPVNVPGELYVGGAGVARGYWHRLDLTAKSFIQHENLPGIMKSPQKHCRRWYKTGDLVKWLPSGDLVFLGRTDAQVKHHGMRIELQEVRNVLLRHSNIKAAEVLAVPQSKQLGTKERQVSSTLVAFVMLTDSINDQSNGEEYTSKLREYLGEHLPMHMVPQSIRVVSCWPRTPNGKIDLRALAGWVGAHSPGARPSYSGEPLQAHSGNSTITVQFATDILRQVWIQALGLDDLQDTDTGNFEERLMSRSFFDLGGDSLAAIRAIALSQARGLTLALDHFFRSSSLPEMARSAAASVADLREWTSDTLMPLNWPTTKPSALLPTLFLFHDADGTVWKLLELARQLPFAVVGVQAATLSDNNPTSTPSSVEELAKVYWNIIRERQCEGPYALGGFSFGCRVAHEVARLAIREGQTVLPLLLLDGLPCEMPSALSQTTNAEKVAIRQRIDEYAAEAFGNSLLKPLGVNYRKYCAMEEAYQPYSLAEVSSGPEPPIWLRADLYMTQRWTADVAAYRFLGIDITIVATISNCTHLTMLRHPTAEQIARQIRQRIIKQT